MEKTKFLQFKELHCNAGKKTNAMIDIWHIVMLMEWKIKKGKVDRWAYRSGHCFILGGQGRLLRKCIRASGLQERPGILCQFARWEERGALCTSPSFLPGLLSPEVASWCPSQLLQLWWRKKANHPYTKRIRALIMDFSGRNRNIYLQFLWFETRMSLFHKS